MTDQIPADKVREIAAAMRAAMHRDDPEYSSGRFLAEMSDYIRDLHALLPTPPRPTLADMPEDERAGCQWMQADIIGGDEPLVITRIDQTYWSALILDRNGRLDEVPAGDVTPRPDLPRMEWPGDTEAAPAPALPDGWRLADHREYGRVVVTNPTPDADGHVYFTFPDDDLVGYDWHFCRPAELTYLDQEDDTADTVPESTLAVGSKWNNSVALTRACEESERDQIVVLDANDYAYTWAYDAEWWEGSAPPIDPPYTIIHTGRKADQ